MATVILDDDGTPVTSDGGQQVVSSYDRFELFARGSKGRKIVIAEIDGLWLVLSERPDRFSTHAFTTRPDDPAYAGELANQRFDPRMKTDGTPLVKRSLVNGDLLRGQSVPDGGSFVLINLDRALTGINNSLKGSKIRVRIGSDGWYVDDFKTVFLGLIDNVDSSRDGRTKTVQYASLDRTFFKRALQTATYRGMGFAVRFGSSTSDKVTFPYVAAFNATTQLCVEAYYQNRVDYFPWPSARDLVSRGSAGAGQIRLFVNGSGKFAFQVRDSGGATTTAVSDLTFLQAPAEARISGRWSGTLLQVFIDGKPDGAAVAFAGPLWAGTEDLRVGTGLDGWATDIRLWVNVDRSDDQIFLNRNRELASDDVLGLELYAKTNEGAGTATFDDLHDYKGTFAGGAAFESTRTGGADLTGKYVSTSWGFVPHCEPDLVDGVNFVYKWHFRSSEALDAVFHGGRKLAPLHSAASTQLTYDSVRKRIKVPEVYVDGSLIPAGPFLPFAPEQSITLTGGSRAGTYTVVTMDLEFGYWIEVAESLATGSDVGTSVTVATATGTHDYTVNLTDSTFELVNRPTLPVTCRVRGDNAGGFVYTPAAIMKRWATDLLGLDLSRIHSSYDDVASDYPLQACYHTGPEEVEAAKALGDMATSIGANWGATTDTDQLDLVVFKEPEEDPNPGDFLDLTEDELIHFNRVRGVQPVKKTTARFKPNFRVLSWDELTASVQEDATQEGIALRQYFTGEWLTETYEPPAVAQLADALATVAEGEDQVLCYLVRREQARRIAFEQWTLYGKEREFYESELKLQPYLCDHRRVTIRATHGNYESTASGKRLRMVSMEGYRTKTKPLFWG